MFKALIISNGPSAWNPGCIREFDSFSAMRSIFNPKIMEEAYNFVKESSYGFSFETKETSKWIGTAITNNCDVCLVCTNGTIYLFTRLDGFRQWHIYKRYGFNLPNDDDEKLQSVSDLLESYESDELASLINYATIMESNKHA